MSRRSLLIKIAVISLATSAVLFAVGSALERHAEKSEKRGSEVTATAARGSGEAHHSGETGPRSGERGGEASSAAPRETHHAETASERSSETRSERIFGVNPDALPLVAAAVGISLLLAAALWFRGSSVVLLGVVAVAGVVAAVFDVREAVHQADHSRPGIMAIAIAVALLHLVASGCAVLLAAGGRGESVGAPSPTV